MTEYAWETIDESGSLHGPFPTVEDAREDVLDHFSPSANATVDIKTVTYIRAEDYADVIDIDSVLDSMNERVWDNYHIDEIVFDVGSAFQNQAETELADLLRAWVIKHVCASGAWHCDGVVERVTTQHLRDTHEDWR